jgi:hypothetical protein
MTFADIHIRDPFILPHNGVYYLYGTRCGTRRKERGYGFDVYTSTDLVTWSEPKAIFEAQADFWGTRDFWAPEVHFYNGKFFLFASFTSDTTCRGTAILICDTPDGEFKPHSDGAITPKDWECLDGTFYVDQAGTPYMVFCHEWLQVRDGTVCAVELTPDLSAPVGTPFQLWNAAAAPWIKAIREEDEFVTDGPFLLNWNGKLASIWSSFDKDGYVEALATSEGDLQGPWSVDHPTLLSGHDGGHGMIFTGFDGVQRFVCHQPNQSPNERPALYRFENGAFFKD